MGAGQFTLHTPSEVAGLLAARARTLRLMRGWTQNSLAERAGVTAASYRRFERLGKGSLALVLRVASALGRLDDFAELLIPPPAASIEELAQRSTQTLRKRGRQ